MALLSRAMRMGSDGPAVVAGCFRPAELAEELFGGSFDYGTWLPEAVAVACVVAKAVVAVPAAYLLVAAVAVAAAVPLK